MSHSTVAATGAPQVAVSVYNLNVTGVTLVVPIGVYWRSKRSRALHRMIVRDEAMALVLANGIEFLSWASFAVGADVDFSSNHSFDTPTEALIGVILTLAPNIRYSSNVDPKRVVNPVICAA